jgi:hypothetical protein
VVEGGGLSAKKVVGQKVSKIHTRKLEEYPPPPPPPFFLYKNIYNPDT